MAEQLQACAAIALGLLAIVSPGDLAAAPPPAPVVDSARPIELELDTSVLEPDLGARLEQRLGEQLPSVLADAGLTLVDPGESHDSVLRARVMSFDADERNYQVELELRSADRTAGRRTIECEACSESRLLTLVLESTAELTASTELLEEHGAPARDTDSSADPADQALAPHVSPGRLGPFGRLGIAGLGLTGAGVTTCVVGVSLLIRKVAHDENSPSTVATTRELRPAGHAALAIGALAVSTGLALVIVDLRRRKPTRTMSAQIGPGYYGLQLQRQF